MTAAVVSMFLFSAAALFFVVRYRVHIHITYEPPETRKTRRYRRHKDQPRPRILADVAPELESSNERVLTETLESLGADRRAARAAARRALVECLDKGITEFNEVLRVAIQQAQPPRRPPTA